MAARYTSKQARMAIRFWRKKLDESLKAESEKDQEEEGKKDDEKPAEEEGGDEKSEGGEGDDFDLDDYMPPEGEEEDAEGGDGEEGADDPEAKIAELEAEIEDLKAKLAKYEGGDEGEGEDDAGSEEEASDDEGDSEEGDEEGDSEEEGDDEKSDDEDDGSEEEKKEDGGSEEEDVDESKKYKPNTVGAVIQLLEKFDPKSKLMIRMNPGKYVCMPIDVSGKVVMKGHGRTYLDIAKGQPR